MVIVPDGARGPEPKVHINMSSSMVERLTLILDAFDDRSSYSSLQEIVSRTKLPRSTVHRILEQLITHDWVEHSVFGYRLGRRALGLREETRETLTRTVVAPLLQELHARTGMVVHLTVLEGGESIYLDKVGGRLECMVPSRVGGRRPAYTTAGGKAMLAWLDPERVHSLYVKRLGRTDNAFVPDIRSLHQELALIRRRHGVAFDREGSVKGVGCVGSAVRGRGPVAAISLCGDLRTTSLERVAPLVATAVSEASRRLARAFGTRDISG